MITDYILKAPTEASLSGLAQLLGYSKTHTGVLVKELTGDPFSRLQQRVCCEEAARLLRQTDMPIAAVIQAVGYQNESFFRNKFRSLYGMTPLQYRKQSLGGEENER